MARRKREKRLDFEKQHRLVWTTLFDSPAVDRDELRRVFLDRARAEEATFAERLDLLDRLILNTHPLSLLSSFSTYFLTSLSQNHEIEKGVEMVQAHGEILQALALRHRWGDFVCREHPSQALQPIGVALAEASRAFSGRRLGEVFLKSSVESARAFIIEFVRSATQFNRNWGYSYQIFRAARELFRPLSADLKNRCGASADELLDFWTALTKLVEDRMNLVVSQVGRVVAEESSDLIVRRVCQVFGLEAEVLENLRDTVQQSSKGLDGTAAALFICLDRLLPMVHLLSWGDVRSACAVAVCDDDLRKLMERWSLTFGALTSTDVELCFLYNPIWERPIICLDSVTWYLPFPSLFFSFCWQVLGGILKGDDQTGRRYVGRRSTYLETAIASEFMRAFPMANVFVGNYWVDPLSGTRYENDVLIQVENVVIVVEAKSGGVHRSASRGASLRLEKAIKELIVEPAIQSRRLESFLKTQHGAVLFSGSDGVERSIDLTGVDTVLCLSITLDHVADLSAVQSHLVASGWVPPKVLLPPSMSLSNLQNVFELLDGCCAKLHYLCRRADLARSARYMGDELDLLAVYFDTLFEIGPAEHDGTRLMVYGASKLFERYFLEIEQGRKPRKPRLHLTRWWSNILTFLEVRLPARWSQIGLDLLSVSEPDQERFAELMREVRENVLRGSVPLNDTVIFVPNSPQRVAIVGVAYLDRTREGRNERLVNAAGQVRLPDGSQPDRVLVIGCDPRIRDIPYSVIALVGFDSGAPVTVEGDPTNQPG